MTQAIYETVSWKARPDVSDQAMIQAVEQFSKSVKRLPGFLHRSLHKDPQGLWVDVYYWQTVEDAENSNALVADDPALHHLITLIEPESLDIRVHQPVQQTGMLAFNP